MLHATLGRGIAHGGDALEARLAAKLTAARAAWPGVEVAPDAVLALWGERLAGVAEDQLGAAIEALRAEELYIACGCGAGDSHALRAFEARYFGSLEGALRRITSSPAVIREVAQIVREKLFVANPERAPILDMAGKGDLGGLVRVVAIRTALNLRRADDRLVPLDRAELAVLASDSDPELAAITSQHRTLVKEALEAALAGLGARDRSVLRMHLLDRLAIDDIGRAHDVHRATAARWIDRIRADLRTATLRRLHTQLGLSSDELESLVRAIESRLEVSFQRILQVSAPA